MKIYYLKFEDEEKVYEHIYKDKKNAYLMLKFVIENDGNLIIFKEYLTND